MANKVVKNNITDERIEDTTMYGEFVSSFHQWITPDRQRQVARHLENVTEVPAGNDTAGQAEEGSRINKKRSN